MGPWYKTLAISEDITAHEGTLHMGYILLTVVSQEFAEDDVLEIGRSRV